MNLANIIKFYNFCYQADNKGAFISNIFSTSNENVYFIENQEELINGNMPYYPLNDKYAEETDKKIKIADKEKELLYCSCFIIGNKDILNKKNKICSPLFIYPAKIIYVDELPFIQINKDQRKINFGIFYEISNNSNNLNKFFEEIFQVILNLEIDLNIIGQINLLIKKYFDNLKSDSIMTYPNLLTDKDLLNIINKIEKEDDFSFQLAPASAVVISNKTINSRGIINELTELSNTDIFSTPLKSIFGFEKVTENKIVNKGYVPAVLSEIQQNVLTNSSKFPFSVIIGPPGTGKSYTISALAIEKMNLGYSILIASGTDKAVDIIAEKIENQLLLPEIIVRAGRSQYKSQIVQYLTSILQNNITFDSEETSFKLYKKILKIEKDITNIKKHFFKRTNKEIKNGVLITTENLNLFQKIKKKLIISKNKKLTPLFENIEKLQVKISLRNDLIIKYIKTKYFENLHQTLTKKRNEIQNLLKAIKTQRGTKQEDLFQIINFEIIFKVFPIWLVKMSDISSVLPLKKELFDFVIIDEATQCDTASSIPVLQRGKKVIITGDHKQLRHFSFLSETQQNIFREKCDIKNIDLQFTDYKNNSLLDVVTENAKFNNQFQTLNEHFRSLPAIINFSNKHFYNSELKIMTSRPDLKQNIGIELQQCSGQRDKNGVNQNEYDYIVKITKNIIINEQNISNNLCSKIGIISPFRDQVDYISKQILNDLTLYEIEKHQISIQTPYGFQGDERDIIIISFVVDNQSNAMSFRYLDKSDVFNVLITRARKMQYILYSIDTKLLKNDSLLRKYLDSFNNNTSQNEKSNAINDAFLDEVKTELQKNKYQIWTDFEIAGYKIDIIISKNNKLLGIDLIGFPGKYQEAFTIERYKILNRAGISIIPISYISWITNKQITINYINKIIF